MESPYRAKDGEACPSVNHETQEDKHERKITQDLKLGLLGQQNPQLYGESVHWLCDRLIYGAFF
jgi:hypothetical protein